MSASSTAPNRSPDNLVDQAQAAHQPTDKDLVLSRITPFNLQHLLTRMNEDRSMFSTPLSQHLTVLTDAQIPASAATCFNDSTELVAKYTHHLMRSKNAVDALGAHGLTIGGFIDASILDAECRHLLETNLRTQCAIFNQDPRSSKFFPCEQEHLLSLKVAAQILDRPSEDSGEAHIQKAYDKLAQQTQEPAIEYLRTAEKSLVFSIAGIRHYALTALSKLMQSYLRFNRAEETLGQNATPSINRVVGQVLNDKHLHPEPEEYF